MLAGIKIKLIFALRLRSWLRTTESSPHFAACFDNGCADP